MVVPTHIIHLLLQLDFRLGQGVDLVLLSLKVIQGLLVGLLQSFLLLGQLGNDLIQPSHLFCQVLHLLAENPIPPGSDITNLETSMETSKAKGQDHTQVWES